MKNKILFPFVLVLLIASCKSKKSTVAVENVPVAAIVLSIPDTVISAEIQESIQHISEDDYKMEGHYLFSSTILPKAYDSNHYMPLWSADTNRRVAIQYLTNSWQHGLLPEDYAIDEIIQYENNYDTLNAVQRADYDILLTDGVLLYAYHVLRGKLDPETLSPTWNFSKKAIPKDALELLMGSLTDYSLAKNLNLLEPTHDAYGRMKTELIYYRESVIEDNWEQVNFPKTLHPGEIDVSIPKLRTRLQAEGYLIVTDSNTSTLYDNYTVHAVEDYQTKHGLTPDGILGTATVKMINLTAEDKLKMLITNLERIKWVDFDESNPYIKVNIASFRMQYFDNGMETYASNVVVGKVTKKTPVFQDEMVLVVLNPTWTLPFSITSTETLSKLKRDSLYLRKHNMVLMTHKGEIVSDEGIDWSKYEKGHFPYMVRQQPGPNNALGQVKFLFPNKYAIYLHDTPSKYLFSREERAFSHGCIRLQNPLSFAAFLLEKQDTTWSMDSIKAVIETRQTMNIRLKHKIPIYLLYQTAGVDDQNQLYFYHDIYGRDEEVYNKLMNKETNEEKVKSRLN